MKTLTKLSQNDIQAIKIKIQGFLYTDRVSIFKHDTVPEPATKYTEEDLNILGFLAEEYEDLFENSLGILTSSHVELNDKKCIACKRCTRFCPSQALEKIGVDLVLHEDRCIRCGNCVGNCPFLALKAPETGLGVYIKNLSSEKPHMLPTLYKVDELKDVLSKIYNFFNENKIDDEVLYEFVERFGFENLLKSIQ
ncbi:4Fe-4S binding protein [Clostridium culturomicium]|uniref:4Fe-4S binding protein n=1 Tax=Clostridium culturomicium TaxID=1499683 RepID=UPI00058F2AA2|nr:4Fe-4S binding protein [Clostridium culturomicium]